MVHWTLAGRLAAAVVETFGITVKTVRKQCVRTEVIYARG